MSRTWLVLALLAVASPASAQTRWDDHGRLWFGADFALGAGRYSRLIDTADARDRGQLGGSLTGSFLWLPLDGFGFGAHVAPGILAVKVPVVEGRVYLFDVGVDALAHLSWHDFELGVRLPFGLSTGRLNWIRDDSEILNRVPGGNDLGLGFHFGAMVGSILWLSDKTGLRIETGPLMRRMKFDEGIGWEYAGAVSGGPKRGNVTHQSWAMMLSLGFVRRYVKRNLPDDNGPPLPTPDYNIYR